MFMRRDADFLLPLAFELAAALGTSGHRAIVVTALTASHLLARGHIEIGHAGRPGR